MRITADNYGEVKQQMKRFLVLEIERYILLAGSQEKLSQLLEKSDTFVQMRIKRGSFGALERLWKDCKSKFEG